MAHFSIPFHLNLGVLVRHRPKYPLEGPTPSARSFDTNCGVPILGANTMHQGSIEYDYLLGMWRTEASCSAKSQSGEAFVGCSHKEVGTKWNTVYLFGALGRQDVFLFGWYYKWAAGCSAMSNPVNVEMQSVPKHKMGSKYVSEAAEKWELRSFRFCRWWWRGGRVGWGNVTRHRPCWSSPQNESQFWSQRLSPRRWPLFWVLICNVTEIRHRQTMHFCSFLALCSHLSKNTYCSELFTFCKALLPEAEVQVAQCHISKAVFWESFSFLAGP